MIEATAPSDTLDVQSARERLDEIVERVRRDGDRVEIEANGKTAAAIVSIDDLSRLRQLDARREEAFAAIAKLSDAFADVPVEELERQVALALANVRARSRAERAGVAGS